MKYVDIFNFQCLNENDVISQEKMKKNLRMNFHTLNYSRKYEICVLQTTANKFSQPNNILLEFQNTEFFLL